MTTLNRHAYENLIKEDLEWLLQQPRTLERDHIEMILRQDAELRYGLAGKVTKAIKADAFTPSLPCSYIEQKIESIIFGDSHD